MMTARDADELIPTRQSLLSRLKNSEDRASWQDFFDTYWKLIHSVAIKSGLTEAEAQQKGIEVKVAKFPWAASGRALSFDRTDGLTKLIIDPESERILGVGIVGQGAGELIAEGVVAIEMGATARDLALCVHPHPTLSETLMEAAEVFYGHPTHTFVKKPPQKQAGD